MLDETATVAELGKSPGKDAASEKLTWVTLYGLAAARKKLDDLELEMVQLATDIEGPGGPLSTVAHVVVHRRK